MEETFMKNERKKDNWKTGKEREELKRTEGIKSRRRDTEIKQMKET